MPRKIQNMLLAVLIFSEGFELTTKQEVTAENCYLCSNHKNTDTKLDQLITKIILSVTCPKKGISHDCSKGKFFFVISKMH